MTALARQNESDNSKQNKLFQVFGYLFSLTLIVNFRTVYVHYLSIPSMNIITLTVMGITTVILIIIKRKISTTKLISAMIIAFLVFVYFGFYYLIDPLKSRSIMKLAMEIVVLVFYCLLAEDSFNGTLERTSNIICVIALYSTVFWLFGSVMHVLQPTGTWQMTWSGGRGAVNVNSYFGIYFETQKQYFSPKLQVIRNSACFTEAPMSSFIFCFALLYELFLSKSVRRPRCILLEIAVLTTLSTTGAIISTAGILLYFINESNVNTLHVKRNIVFKLGFFFVLIIAGIFIIKHLLDAKLITHSGISRTNDFMNGFLAWLDSPIFGYGFNGEALESQYGNYGFSNSIIPILTYGGIYLFFPYLCAMVVPVYTLIKTKKWSELSFYGLFLCMFAVTITPFQNLVLYVFLAMILRTIYRHTDT